MAASEASHRRYHRYICCLCALLFFLSAGRLPCPGDRSACPNENRDGVLSGGCFWGVEAVFERLKGVTGRRLRVRGGKRATAHYEMVGTGRTGHAESVADHLRPVADLVRQARSRSSSRSRTIRHSSTARVPTRARNIGRPSSMPPTSRSASPRHTSSNSIRRRCSSIRSSRRSRRWQGFYAAEDYHQDYIAHNPGNPYVVYNDLPKLASSTRNTPTCREKALTMDPRLQTRHRPLQPARILRLPRGARRDLDSRARSAPPLPPGGDPLRRRVLSRPAWQPPRRDSPAPQGTSQTRRIPAGSAKASTPRSSLATARPPSNGPRPARRSTTIPDPRRTNRARRLIPFAHGPPPVSSRRRRPALRGMRAQDDLLRRTWSARWIAVPDAPPDRLRRLPFPPNLRSRPPSRSASSCTPAATIATSYS